MIVIALLISVAVLGSLLSYARGYDQGYKSGNCAAEFFEARLAERDGWHAAYHALLDLVPEEQKECATHRAHAAFDVAHEASLRGDE